MNSGKGLTNDLRNTLLIIAVKMIKEDEKKQRIRGDYYEGEIKTENKRTIFVTISGIEFKAILEMDKIKTTVIFVVRDEFIEYFDEEDIKYLHWIGGLSEQHALNTINARYN